MVFIEERQTDRNDGVEIILQNLLKINELGNITYCTTVYTVLEVKNRIKPVRNSYSLVKPIKIKLLKSDRSFKTRRFRQDLLADLSKQLTKIYGYS